MINQDIFVLILFSFIFSIYSFYTGRIFCKFLKLNYNKNSLESFSLQSILGIFFLGIFALISNFFVPVNTWVTFVFLLIIFTLNFLLFKNNFKHQILLILIISFLIVLFLYKTNLNRPDAYLYHLPYIEILNNYKIIPGIANLHERYGWISILQYISSMFHFSFFQHGIIFPNVLIFIFTFIYLCSCIVKIDYKKKINFFKVLSLIFLIFIFLRFNRYSDYGNDHPASLLLILYTVLFFKIFDDNLKRVSNSDIFLLLSLSSFIFLIKVTFFIPLLFSIILMMIFDKNFLKNWKYYFLLCVGLIWVLKNLLISGCIIYPFKPLCFETLPWYSNNQNFNISAYYSAIGTEAWSKGWPDYKGEINSFSNYISNFNWLDTWFDVHFKIIIKKLFPFVILMLLLIFALIVINKKISINFSVLKNKIILSYILLTLLSFIIWFLKFPVFRFGAGIIAILSSILFALFISKFKNITLVKYFVLFSFVILLGKNLLRIYKTNNDTFPELWPQQAKYELMEKKLIFYSENNDNYCGYKKPLCTPYREYFKNFNVDEFYGYKYIVLKK